MKYYVLEITTANGATAKAVTEKASEKEAMMLYHQIMGSALANDNVTYALCMVINEEGFALVSDKYPRAEETT